MIEVVFSRPRRFHVSSWLIMKATRFDASHASLHFKGRGVFAGKTLVLEATGSGVRIVPRSRWDDENVVAYTLTMRARVEAGMLSLATILDSLGTSYDFRGLFSFALRMVARRLGFMLKPVSTPSKVFCSELVARWWREVCILSSMDLPELFPDETSPADLHTIMSGSDVFS